MGNFVRAIALTAFLVCASCTAAEPSPPGTYSPASTPGAAAADSGSRFRFPGVYCLRFPSGALPDVQEQYFSGGAVYLVRAEYPPDSMLNVVASTVPGGRPPDVELDRLLGVERTLEAGYGTDYHIGEVEIGGVRAIRETIYDVTPGGDGGPFPLVRALFKNDASARLSISAHRIFVRGSNRFEVAAWRRFNSPASSSELSAAETALNTLVDEASASLLSCPEG